MKAQDYEKYKQKMRYYIKLDAMALDDFLLHTLTDESEVKVLFELL